MLSDKLHITSGRSAYHGRYNNTSRHNIGRLRASWECVFFAVLNLVHRGHAVVADLLYRCNAKALQNRPLQRFHPRRDESGFSIRDDGSAVFRESVDHGSCFVVKASALSENQDILAGQYLRRELLLLDFIKRDMAVR